MSEETGPGTSNSSTRADAKAEGAGARDTTSRDSGSAHVAVQLKGNLITSDGCELWLREWQPSRQPKSAILLVHGHGEHSGRYDHVGRFFASAGHLLVAYDQRGHGRSGGRRGHAPTYERLIDDLAQVWSWVGRRHPNVPRFLLGHSFGGQVVLEFARTRSPKAEGVVVVAPWLQLKFRPPFWKVALGKSLARVWPSFTLPTGLGDLVELSHDKVHLLSTIDSSCHSRVTARLGAEGFEAAQRVLEKAGELRLPTLVLHGGDDEAIDVKGSKELVAKMGDVASLKVYPGMYHEILNEVDRIQVMRDIVEWIEHRPIT